MTPEGKARQKIDQWFADAGWKVADRENYEPTCTAVAIREGLLKDFNLHTILRLPPTNSNAIIWMILSRATIQEIYPDAKRHITRTTIHREDGENIR